MSMKTKSTSPAPRDADPDEKPSTGKMRSLLAQLHLTCVLEELTDLRKTLRLQAAALDEYQHKSNLPPEVVTELIATVQRRDRQFATRLAKLRTTVSKANRLLTPPDDQPAKQK